MFFKSRVVSSSNPIIRISLKVEESLIVFQDFALSSQKLLPPHLSFLRFFHPPRLFQFHSYGPITTIPLRFQKIPSSLFIHSGIFAPPPRLFSPPRLFETYI